MEDVATLVAALERAPGRFVDDAGEVPLPELADRVRRLAAGLRRRGLGPGATIGVWLPNQREWVETVLAAGLLGARAAGINPRYRVEELRHAASETGMTHLVYRPAFAGSDYTAMLAEQGIGQELELVRVGDRDALDALDYEDLLGDEREPGACGAEDLWVVFFTSGTTSKPKAAVHDHRSLVSHAVHCAQRQELDETGAVLATLPFCGVMGFVSYLEGLAVGATTVTMDRFDAETAAELLVEHRVTTWNTIDEMLRRVIVVPRARDAALHTGAVANFGPDPAGLLREADAVLGGTITQPYGMSEVQALTVCSPVDAAQERHDRPGGPIVTPGTEMRICEPDTNRVLPDGERGELQMRGTTVAAGYLRDGGELHPLGGEDGWFPTGDLGYLEGDELTYLSRFKDAMRLRGFLVNPREIEDTLAAHPAVETAQVVAVERSGRTVAVAFVQGDAALDPEEVRAWCREHMADFKVPAEIRRVDEYPTTNGPHGAKVRKEVLRQWAQDDH
jgi:fatty-acyl-CoA synthase